MCLSLSLKGISFNNKQGDRESQLCFVSCERAPNKTNRSCVSGIGASMLHQGNQTAASDDGYPPADTF